MNAPPSSLPHWAPRHAFCRRPANAAILTWPYFLRLLFKHRAIAVRSHLIRKQVKKSTGGLLARRAVFVLKLKRLRHGGRNTGMLEDTAVDRVFRPCDHGAPRNPWRYGDRRHAHAQPIEGERRARPGGFRGSDEAVRRASRRRHMVVYAAVFVISNQQQGALPQVGILTNRVVDGGDEGLAGQHVVIWVLVRGDQLAAAVILMVAVVRFDETVVRQPVLLTVAEEVLVKPEQSRLSLEQIDNLL